MDIDEPISITTYDRDWPSRAAAEIARIQGGLGEHAIHSEHIGSTSVPGCDAKPVIDILVGLRTWPASADIRRRLSQLGYEDLGEAGVPGRLYFRARGTHAFNLAVTRYESDLWCTNLAIRDLLRGDPRLVQEYREAKQAALGAGCTTLLAYSQHKAQFMSRLVERATRR